MNGRRAGQEASLIRSLGDHGWSRVAQRVDAA
jgi:hypothetical protein